MNKNIFRVIKLLFLLLPLTTHAWNATGHRVVAAIAYEHLTPSAKQKVNALTHALDNSYHRTNFIAAASWPDEIKYHEINVYDHWHYYDKAFSYDGSTLPASDEHNVMWAITQAEKIVASPKSSYFEKGMYLRFLTHFVADIHQPLHAASLVSKAHPKGDQGGNLFALHSRYGKSLHVIWDNGLGMFAKSKKTYRKKRARQINKLARKIERDYPESYFGQQAHDLEVADWAQESFHIAKEFVYRTPHNKIPSKAYVRQGRKLVEQRIALAGYRLAAILNRLAA